MDRYGVGFAECVHARVSLNVREQPVHASQGMTDCRFGASNLTAATLSLTAEYAFQPHSRFWRDFNVAYLVGALTLRVPDWRAALAVGLVGDRCVDGSRVGFSGGFELHGFSGGGGG